MIIINNYINIIINSFFFISSKVKIVFRLILQWNDIEH